MKRVLSALAIVLFFSAWTYAQKADYTQNRTALVIGNSAYDEAPLKNPANDAKAIGATLRELGFDVLEYTDLDKEGMKKAMREFSELLKTNPGVGLFYYAGHGIQSDGVNYLVPVRSNVEEQFEIEFECIKADRALAVMEYSNNPFNVVIMDACRNNPFRSFFRSADQGFATPTNPPTGSIVAFATQPGKTASDGTGENGLYTQELVKAMKTPGIPIEEVFKQVRINVSRMSDNKQVPQEWSSLMGDFYFKEKPVVAEPVQAATQPKETNTYKVADDPQVKIGTATRAVGTIQLTTVDVSGILYIDGEEQLGGTAIEGGVVLPVRDVTIGKHKVEIKGQSGTWSQEVLVLPNETTTVMAMNSSPTNSVASSRDITNNDVPVGDLIPVDNGDVNVYSPNDVDKEAKPLYGMDAFMMLLEKEVQYPALAKKAKIVGQVQVQVVVEKTGVISEAKVVRSLGYGCDDEAVRAIMTTPLCWNPATKGGNAVRQTVVVGVPFSR